MQLKDSSLLRQKAYIDGAWSSADNGRTHAVRNPANGETIAHVPDMGGAETRRAIALPTPRCRAGVPRRRRSAPLCCAAGTN